MLVTNNITGEVEKIEDVEVEIVSLTDEQKEQLYKNLVVSYIREQYASDDEQAILRKKLAGIDNGEFEIFNTYVEECKVKAKAEVYEIEVSA